MRRRGKAIAITSVVVGLVVIVAAGIASKDWIWEGWYINRLGEEEYTTRRDAAAWLARMRSIKAVPALIEAHRHAQVRKAAAEAVVYDWVLSKMGKDAVPALLRARFYSPVFAIYEDRQGAPRELHTLRGQAFIKGDLDAFLASLRDDPQESGEVRKAAEDVLLLNGEDSTAEPPPDNPVE